jgi:trimeric autotransporter adhesin
VSADALPTVQQNGVVWAEVTVGNTVYATGHFSATYPAGAAKTTANRTPRANLLAFNITTGKLIASFNHRLNGQGLAITASPNGSRIYVVGDFTTVDGWPRHHIAAFDTANGALDPNFRPSISARAGAVSATNSKVYVGGNFFSVNGVPRVRLAAFGAGNGSLLRWAPTADDNMVTAMVVTPDHSEVVIGGRFLKLDGVANYGLGAVNAVTGALVPYAAHKYIRDYSTGVPGTGAGIESLTTDGKQVYGSGFSTRAGNFEGNFGLDPDTGRINFLNDCHGDTYDVFPVGKVLYTVGHNHDCSAIGAFPNTEPSPRHHALAFTTYPTGTNTGPDSNGWNYNGLPDSTLLHWYPTLTHGTVTGENQAAWAITGNAKYIALGGEFPSVNGNPNQSGLVRFAVPSLAPNKMGPLNSSSLTPSVASLYSGAVRVSWQATWDYDNQDLTYRVYRDGGTTPVYTATAPSTFWQLPKMGFVDTGLTPGSSHTYRVQAVDPFGNTITSSASSPVTISSAPPPGTYIHALMTDGARHVWRFNEASGTTAYDWARYGDLTEGSGVIDGADGPLLNDTATAATFTGTPAGTAATTTAIKAPNTFSIEAWIKTTTTYGGKIVGFGNAKAGIQSSTSDRHVYMDNAGHLNFGVYNNGAHIIASPARYNDGNWHYIVAELSRSGMRLFIDGDLVAQNLATTVGEQYSGYWHVGGDNLIGWPSRPASNDFAGTIADVAVYARALTAQQVQAHYSASGRY